ncbi:unnamed protein product [Calicophoron daubneyi]|uniref:Uncharacterized protein n=1 Tax=Calicophoron daubneyi TaxID=300641 RepID=A0AAV2TEX2_CALDB
MSRSSQYTYTLGTSVCCKVEPEISVVHSPCSDFARSLLQFLMLSSCSNSGLATNENIQVHQDCKSISGKCDTAVNPYVNFNLFVDGLKNLSDSDLGKIMAFFSDST